MKLPKLNTLITACAAAVMLSSPLTEVAAQSGDASGRNVSPLWLEFVEAKKTGGEATLPDFSYAGYRHGEEAVPYARHKVFNVCDYGAVPGDGKSDRAAVEKAIAAAEANGSGIIFFPRGRYDLHGEGDPDTPIYISGSNIVLRGEGYGEGGTEIFMELPNNPTDPDKMWTSPDLLLFRSRGPKAEITKVTGDSPRGSFSVRVADASSLKAGDWVCLQLLNNDPQLVAEELSPYCVEEGWNDIAVKGVNVQDYHQIASVKGKTVTFKEPIMRRVDSKWGWILRKFPRLENVGVENIAFIGNFHDEFVHHKSWYHDGGYKMFSFNGAVNSWVRDCRFTNVSECISVISSANVSVFDCVITGNVGHSAMRAQGSSRVFFGRIDDQPAQWHSVGVSKPAMGNVIWRTTWTPGSCFESHASQPRATLFDMCEGGFMRGRAGGAEASNPNHLADLVLWNFHNTGPSHVDFDFWATDTPYWRFLPPVIVGFHGNPTSFVQDQVVADESNGTPVYPESLYEAQLELRLGSLPQWLVELKNK